MTYLKAAIIVLSASKRPLTTAEIIEQIAKQNLMTFTGQTPLQTLSAALYRNLGKHPTLRRAAVEGPDKAVKRTSAGTLQRTRASAGMVRARTDLRET